MEFAIGELELWLRDAEAQLKRAEGDLKRDLHYLEVAKKSVEERENDVAFIIQKKAEVLQAVQYLRGFGG